MNDGRGRLGRWREEEGREKAKREIMGKREVYVQLVIKGCSSIFVLQLIWGFELRKMGGGRGRRGRGIVGLGGREGGRRERE